MATITWLKFLAISLCLTISICELVEGLDNGLARTPPMGWIAWERFTCNTNCDQFPHDCVHEGLFREMADRLAEDGYLEAGYEYVNVDDCWSEFHRDIHSKQLIADHLRFPNGMAKLAEYVHSKGVKFGIYGDCGNLTCAGYPAQLKDEQNLDDNYFDSDANSFAEWEIDSFKFDSCNLDPAKAESICPKMAQSLKATSRPIMLICEWPFYMLRDPFNLKPDYSLVSKACNAWRYFEDVEDSWQSVLSIIDYTISMQSTIVKYHGPGHWFDPDQLIIGNFALSLDQARSQMAIWCIWAAPLYMGNDLRNIEPEMAKILKNERLIAVNQDQLGVFGLMVESGEHGVEQAFVKPVEPIKNGCPSFAIVYLNRAKLGNSRPMSFKLRDLLAKSAIHVAAERYASLYPNNLPGGPFNGQECEKMLRLGASKQARDLSILIEPQNQLPAQLPIEERQFVYQVLDLFNDPSDVTKSLIGLNENLTLSVHPSGVRMVKLVLREQAANGQRSRHQQSS